jgi:type VI protein secretion system component VasF
MIPAVNGRLSIRQRAGDQMRRSHSRSRRSEQIRTDRLTLWVVGAIAMVVVVVLLSWRFI